MPYDNKLPRVLISENCISHLKMRVFWLSGPNGWPDKKLKHKGNVAHSTFRGGCVIDLVWKNYSLYVKIAIFSYKLDTLYNFQLNSDGKMSIVKIKSKTLFLFDSYMFAKYKIYKVTHEESHYAFNQFFFAFKI